jgi:phosphoribosylaminoimidazole-succinocarboxamide synthase
MTETSRLLAQLPHALADASPLKERLGLEGFYQGKVRDNFVRGKERILVVSDRISAFDRLLGVIPFKGEMLTQMARFWFERTKDVVPNHLISVPDPQVMIARECKAIAVEVVVRARLTGSLWRDYQKGAESNYGITLPRGMVQYQAFEEPIITPSTKAAYGEHDTPISPKEIVKRGLCTYAHWEDIKNKAMKLFELGAKHAESRGLVLVDTKYEFGFYGKEIIAIDEVHTPDSSRYWYKDDLEGRIEAGVGPRMLDKEFLRGWLLARGFSGEGDAPEIPDTVRAELAARYLELYEVLTGHALEVHEGPALERVTASLQQALKAR